ncbi:MAG: thiamine-phosphate kinase, partial [Gammaproteobacteria bacterium]
MSEFDLINDYFRALDIQRQDVVLGIGDDCAILQVPDGHQLAVSSDTLIAGVHFPHDTSA